MKNTDDRNTPGRRMAARWWLRLAALCACLYALNVGLRMLHIKHGVSFWRLGDVGEFTLVLVAMAFFVAGVLALEESS